MPTVQNCSCKERIQFLFLFLACYIIWSCYRVVPSVGSFTNKNVPEESHGVPVLPGFGHGREGIYDLQNIASLMQDMLGSHLGSGSGRLQNVCSMYCSDHMLKRIS